MINSIVKGKVFERKIVNLLSEGLGISFKRVPNSGGFATSEKVEDFRFKGDVFSENKQFIKMDCGIECKITGESISLFDFVNFMYKGKGIIKEWVLQCCTEFAGHNFLLIFKYKGSPEFLIRGIFNKEDGYTIVLPVFLKDALEPLKNELSEADSGDYIG
jgi:hypothetical protein